MRRKWMLWLAAAAAVLVVLVVAKGQMKDRSSVQASSQLQVKAVVAEPAVKVKKEILLELTGNVEPIRESVVSTKVAGRVAKVLVDDGDFVSPGQPLVLLEDTEYRNALDVNRANLDRARANLDRAQAGLELARSNYNRYKMLYDSGALSAKDYEAAQNSLVLAQAEVNAARADVNAASAAVASAQENLSNTSLRSPIGGVVSSCDVKVGQYVTPGLSLLKVEDISNVYAAVNIGQADIALVKKGLPAKVAVDAFGDRVFEGQVEVVNPVGDSSTRVFETRVKVPNGSHYLRPGMFVKVKISTGKVDDAIAVPQNALISSSGMYFVFVLEGNRVKRCQVEPGEVVGQLVEIKSGIKDGQKVVITDVNTLKDGDRVVVADRHKR